MLSSIEWLWSLLNREPGDSRASAWAVWNAIGRKASHREATPLQYPQRNGEIGASTLIILRVFDPRNAGRCGR